MTGDRATTDVVVLDPPSPAPRPVSPVLPRWMVGPAAEALVAEPEAPVADVAVMELDAAEPASAPGGDEAALPRRSWVPSGRGPRVLAGLVVVGFAVWVGAMVVDDAPPDPGPRSEGSQAPGGAAVTAADRGCESGPGGTDSLANAVLAFEHGYYSTRDAAAARSVVAREGSGGIAAAPEMQAAIDGIPVGTTACVEVLAERSSSVDVRVQAMTPGKAAPELYDMRVSGVQVADGSWRLTRFEPLTTTGR